VFIFFLHGPVDVGKFVHNIRPYFSPRSTLFRRAANEQLYSTTYISPARWDHLRLTCNNRWPNT